jgi:beta-lactamase regulating signal transducer with metallopeptidase domain
MASGAVFGLPLVLVAAVIARPFGTAATRYRIYVAAFIAAAAFAPLAFIASYLRPASPASAHGVEHAVAQYAPLPLFALCVVIASLLLGDLAIDLFKLLRIKAFSRIVEAIPRQHRSARVAASALVQTPTAIGYLHPRIVVPLDLPERVSADELQAIVAHENAHLERYDDWTKALQTAIVRLSWFAPALWALATRMDLERELASDERVLARSFDARVYAGCLVRLAADVRRAHTAPAAWISRSQVAVRVERLLKPAGRLGWYAGAIRVSALVVAIGFSGLAALVVVPPAAEPPVATGPAGIVAWRTHHLTIAPHHRTHPAARAIHHASVAMLAGPAEVMILSRVAQPGRVIAAPVATKRADPEVVAMAPIGPCRACVLLRRPVADGPGRTNALAPLQALPEHGTPTGPDDGSGRYGYPWDPDLTRTTTAFDMFVQIGPTGR